MASLPASIDDRLLAAEAVKVAAELLELAERQAPRSERRRRRTLGPLVEDDLAMLLVLELADEVVRITDTPRAGRRFRELIRELGVPASLKLADRLSLSIGARLADLAPGVVGALVKRRTRRQSRGVIIPAEEKLLAHYVRARREAGFALNINVLGEATLGEEEAERRLKATEATFSRGDVGQVSVKISAICSQVSSLAFDATVSLVEQRLLPLFLSARERASLVNLDMEEYRDLHLTVAVFKTLLERADLLGFEAGLALQAYLPDSFVVLQDLCEWAVRRRANGAAGIKVRLVKGANLPMEKVEAELRGWEQAPYPTKHEVDANYKRLLETALAPEYSSAVRVGLASHNVFDIAWGLVLRERLGAQDRLEFEMLEGMAEGLARAVKQKSGRVLMYAPVVSKAQFDAAIAYLVRRLDENTERENFLPALLDLRRQPASFEDQKALFLAAVDARHAVSAGPRRSQDRNRPGKPGPEHHFSGFRNEPDTDFSLERNRHWVVTSFEHWEPGKVVPVAVGGLERAGPAVQIGYDPSWPANETHRWATASSAEVDEALLTAAAAAKEWDGKPIDDRRRLLYDVAEQLASDRGTAIVTMCHETAKIVQEADTEVSEAIDFARYYAFQTRLLEALAEQGADPKGGRVVLVCGPWNFPYSIPAGGVLAALSAGHAVILKPAPEAVLTAWALAQSCWAAGVPRELLQFVPCQDDEVGLRLVTHPDFARVVLTGSYETATAFTRAYPGIKLRAETSGKNALIITAAADLDLAVRDLVRSAFGHAGQKCSAASLGIVEAAVYDSATFQRRLADAVRSLRVGPATDLSTDVGPLVRPPGPELLRALTSLDPGEDWLVQPRRAEGPSQLWHPGVKLGVSPGSWSHKTEWFGPVLGLMRAEDLESAIDWQNTTGYGLTGGIHSLDPAEVKLWEDRAEVGNAYVNRTITGAIVSRQPFGGWKRSSVGPVAKAGGPNYVLSLCDWSGRGGATPSLEECWQREFTNARKLDDLTVEHNELRYRPLPGPVTVRGGEDTSDSDLGYALSAARAAGVRAELSLAAPRRGLAATVEDDISLEGRIKAGAIVRLRFLGTVPTELLRVAHETAVPVDDTPFVQHPRLELLRWTREQSLSVTAHRHGRVLAARG
ncbi:MAG TPA: proline dehydrogenase family protein [Acidimicrobiales bacterium]|nr:proline dehydrogenase family protein [Acidimicrobiales bacterium]